MNDRFKFRIFVKNELNPKYDGMFKVHSLHLGTNKVIISSQHGNCSIKLDNDNVLMQSTGLRDKNSKLIYEGDIVEIFSKTLNNKSNCVVGWNDIISGFTFVGYGKMVARFDETWEVIGNIYENKELLEKE